MRQFDQQSGKRGAVVVQKGRIDHPLFAPDKTEFVS